MTKKVMSKNLNAATALAALSRCHTRVGAILVKNGQVIAASLNIITGGSNAHYRRMTVHAEEAVLRQAGVNAKGCDAVRGSDGAEWGSTACCAVRAVRSKARQARYPRCLHDVTGTHHGLCEILTE